MEYQLINYDLIGNEKDGYEVNGAYYTDIYINIKESDSDKIIIQKLKQAGYININAKDSKFEIDGESGFTFYINYSSKAKWYPFCELRKVKK